MPIRSLSRKQYFWIAVTLIYTAIFLLLLIFQPGGKETFETVFSLAHITPHIFAGISCWRFVRKGQHPNATSRLGWFLIGLSCFSYLAGDIIFFVYTSSGTGKVPYPSIADAAWLGVFPFLIAGSLLLFGKMPSAGRARLLLDSTIGASSIGILIWYFLVRYLWSRSGLPMFGKLVSIAYPLGDFIVLFVAFVLLNMRLPNRGIRFSLSLLAFGTLLWSFSDTFYTYHRFHDHYHIGSWFDWGWPFGALMIGWACLSALWAKQPAAWEPTAAEEAASRPRTVWSLLAPYIAAGSSLLAVMGYDFLRNGSVDDAFAIVGAGMMLLILLRQICTLFENRHLTTQLRTINEELESRVEQRTGQMRALLMMTQAVNNTLDVEAVLASAVTHIRQMFPAELIVTWRVNATGQTSCAFCFSEHIGLEEHPALAAQFIKFPLLSHVEALVLSSEATGFEGILLRAPLRRNDVVLGMIGIVSRHLTADATERELLESVGIEVGTALDNALRFRQAQEAADRDPVTNLYNHRAIHQRLDQELLQLEGRQADAPGSLAVVMMDMNNFKMFNDTYGHPVGDQVLRNVAQTLGEECGTQGLAGRYGGDEFCVVLPNTDAAHAVAWAAHVEARMAEQGFRAEGEDRTIPVTLSFGIAMFPDDGVSRNELMRVADSNLYSAKQHGNTIRVTTAMQRVTRQLCKNSSFDILDAMVTAVDNKDSYTRQHSEDVTEYALWIAEELNVTEETYSAIQIGGLLHDVGKISVPDDILRKPGRLTSEEYDLLKRHAWLGAMIVSAIPGMEDIVSAVRSHHERWDGKGYPDGTAGEETPFLGRVLAVADAFSAMTTSRPYRKGMDWELAFVEIEKHQGAQFDPMLAEAFLRAARKRQALNRKANETVLMVQEISQPAPAPDRVMAQRESTLLQRAA